MHLILGAWLHHTCSKQEVFKPLAFLAVSPHDLAWDSLSILAFRLPIWNTHIEGRSTYSHRMCFICFAQKWTHSHHLAMPEKKHNCWELTIQQSRACVRYLPEVLQRIELLYGAPSIHQHVWCERIRLQQGLVQGLCDVDLAFVLDVAKILAYPPMTPLRLKMAIRSCATGH